MYRVAGDLSSLLRTQVELTDIVVIEHVKFVPAPVARGYPSVMPFFLYGTSKEQHIEHALCGNENVQLNSSCVQLDFGPSTERIVSAISSSAGYLLTFDDLRESAMLPFGPGHCPDFFAPNRTFRVTLHLCARGLDAARRESLPEDSLDDRESVAQGTLTLGESVYIDYMHVNRDTVPRLCITPTEQLTRDMLLLSVTNDYQKIVDDIHRVVSHDTAHAAPDLEEHILAQTALPTQYTLGRADDAQDTVAPSNSVHLSRFVIPYHSDAHSRRMKVRGGWKGMFDDMVAACRN